MLNTPWTLRLTVSPKWTKYWPEISVCTSGSNKVRECSTTGEKPHPLIHVIQGVTESLCITSVSWRSLLHQKLIILLLNQEPGVPSGLFLFPLNTRSLCWRPGAALLWRRGMRFNLLFHSQFCCKRWTAGWKPESVQSRLAHKPHVATASRSEGFRARPARLQSETFPSQQELDQTPRDQSWTAASPSRGALNHQHREHRATSSVPRVSYMELLLVKNY